MKKCILILAVSLTSITAVASTNDCEKTRSTANSIMSLRQQGFDVDTIKKSLSANSKDMKVRSKKEAEFMADKTLELLDKAYSVPLQDSLSMQYLSSKSFEKSSFLNCISDKNGLKDKEVVTPVSTVLISEIPKDIKIEL